MIESPFESKPVLPARPLICLYLAASISSLPTKGPLNMTALAGKLIPVLNVLVAQRTNKLPYRNPFSTTSLSSLVNPEWWYATPYGIVYPNTWQSPDGQ